MTKQEAIIEMQKGIKVIHTYFSPWEWMTLQNGEFIFEDGYTIEPDRFWEDRQDEEWNIGWDYYPDLSGL